MSAHLRAAPRRPQATSRCRFCGKREAIGRLMDPCNCYKKSEGDLVHPQCLRAHLERLMTSTSDAAAKAALVCPTCGVRLRVTVRADPSLTHLLSWGSIATAAQLFFVSAALSMALTALYLLSHARGGAGASITGLRAWELAVVAVAPGGAALVVLVRRWLRMQQEILVVDSHV
ncbi:unnamed protein product [Pedinophyceae sp. YPF-701]|nr:unnamed protein product [Pedinophyceae sp. YPF-701]